MHLPEPKGGDFEIAPAGTHLGVCCRVVDLGTQEIVYDGKTSHQHKILLSWELPDENMADGRPFIVNKRYTFSMHEKATLRKHLESWRGKAFTKEDFGRSGFDLQKILGVGCMLSVLHGTKGEKTYASVESVSKLMKGATAPSLKGEAVYLSLLPDRWNEATFNGLGEYWQGVIMKSPEYKRLVINPPAADPTDMDDEIPF